MYFENLPIYHSLYLLQAGNGELSARVTRSLVGKRFNETRYVRLYDLISYSACSRAYYSRGLVAACDVDFVLFFL